MTLLHGISVILLSKPEKWKLDTNRSNNTNQNRLLIINTEEISKNVSATPAVLKMSMFNCLITFVVTNAFVVSLLGLL